MSFRPFLAALAVLVSPLAHAASSAQLLTPQAMSVAGGETKAFSARFFDALGQPVAGQAVRFGNDACGFFPNGGFFMDTVTDTTGTATLNFTAMIPAGITCWLNASAGVTAHWDVHTYQPGGVRLTYTTNPATPRTGEAYTLSVVANWGAYTLYNVDIGARVIPGSVTAAISTATASTGNWGAADFQVTPDSRLGDYLIELDFKGRKTQAAMTTTRNDWQDLWWSGPAENGWGMSVVQHQTTLFCVIYAYDANGKPIWYVMPGGAWNATNTAFSGAVYLPRGSPYSAYDTAKFDARAPVGQVTLTFTGASSARLDYTVSGVTGHKEISRQPFGSADQAFVSKVGDMWWGGATQNGWGLAVLQQFRALFSVWFTYDANGMPTWFVMPQGTWSDVNTYEGPLYRTAGSPWLGQPYDANALQVAQVGTFQLRFGAASATFDYVIDQKAGTMPLVRQPF